MKDSKPRHSSGLRNALLAAVAIGAFPFAAFAKDVPPTQEGAEKLGVVFATYLGKPVEGAPAPVTVVVEGDHYAVAVDLAALTAPFKASGFSMDPAVMKYALTEQDDGTWHVVSDALPPISAHAKDSAFVYDFAGYKFDGVFDPTTAVFKTAKSSLEKVTAQVHAPNFEENVAFGATEATQTGAPAANGAASAAVHEEIADVAVKASVVPGGPDAAPDAKPVPFTVETPKVVADVVLDGAPLRKALDVWAFVAAHPGRPGLAAEEPAFKDLLRKLLPTEINLAEKVEVQKATVTTSQGAFGLASGKFGVAASSAPGPTGALEYHFAADGVSLPPGLLPPAMQGLAPTAFNIDLKATGLDLGAGAEEAIADMHLEGDGPVIAEADRGKIFTKMKGSAPLVVELSPSHIVAPQLDATLEGQVHLEGERPNGVLKVKIRNFDKTVAALKALGPLVSPQMISGLTMAKALGKTDSDGALSWVAEYGVDGSIKVNGLPLGKAP
jgi:hypothetical protein